MCASVCDSFVHILYILLLLCTTQNLCVMCDSWVPNYEMYADGDARRAMELWSVCDCTWARCINFEYGHFDVKSYMLASLLSHTFWYRISIIQIFSWFLLHINMGNIVFYSRIESWSRPVRVVSIISNFMKIQNEKLRYVCEYSGSSPDFRAGHSPII